MFGILVGMYIKLYTRNHCTISNILHQKDLDCYSIDLQTYLLLFYYAESFSVQMFVY